MQTVCVSGLDLFLKWGRGSLVVGLLCVCMLLKATVIPKSKKSKENQCLPKLGSNSKDWVPCHLPCCLLLANPCQQ